MLRNQTRLQEWRFQVDQNDLGVQRGWHRPDFDKSGWMTVQAAKPWDLYEPAFWGYEGIGWFAAVLPAHSVDPLSLQRIVFHSVSGHSQIWVNGSYLGEHFGAYLPFDFALTPYLQADGVNEIVLRVDNRHQEHWLPGGPVVEWIQYGGLLQPVTLETVPRTYINERRIRTRIGDDRTAVVQCEIKVAHTASAPFRGMLRMEIAAGAGTIVAETPLSCGAAETTAVTVSLTVPDPVLWELDNPHLYTIAMQLFDSESPIDSIEQKCGIRTIATIGNQIVLNGKPIVIKGFNRYDEYLQYGPSAPANVIREDLMKIKRTGANLIRVHYPQDPVHLELMDEIGLLFMEEIPLNWWLSEGRDRPYIPEVVDRAEIALEEMIRRDGNHPCVIAWSMCNESGTNSEEGIAAMRRLLGRARQLDPDRLVTFVTTGSPGHLAFEDADLVCVNLYYGLFHQNVALDIPSLDELVRVPTEKHLRATADEYAGKPVVMTEFGTHGILGLQSEDRFSETYQAAYLEKVWQAILDAGIQGGVVWSWADYYHRRDFVGTSDTMWKSPYGPYGVVTIDRKEKAAYRTIKRLFDAATV